MGRDYPRYRLSLDAANIIPHNPPRGPGSHRVEQPVSPSAGGAANNKWRCSINGKPTAKDRSGDGMMGRPSKRTPEVISRILDGLSAGTPLAVICRQDDMPATNTVHDWGKADPELSAAIARARETGFDVIAQDALAIADDGTRDTIETDQGPIMDKEWVARSKLRVETRLKLLSKWDPKRYGERLAIAGDETSPLHLTISKDDAAL